MIQTTDFIKDLRKQKFSVSVKPKGGRVFIKMKPKDFKEAFILCCEIEMGKRGVFKPFIVDETNREIINQLYWYIVGDSQFKGDLSKSILLSGSIGAGKTIMVNSICKIVEAGSNKVITRMHAKKMSEMIKEQEIGFYDVRPLFIDDLGREPKEANSFGNKSEPMIDLMSVRYDLGSWTFATTNFKRETLSEFYGKAIADRFDEMFNVIVLKGETRRE